MNDLEAEDILSFVAGDNFEVACEQHGRQTVLDALTHAAQALRERAAAEPVAWCQPDSLDNAVMTLKDGKADPRLTLYSADGTGWMTPLYTAPPSSTSAGATSYTARA